MWNCQLNFYFNQNFINYIHILQANNISYFPLKKSLLVCAMHSQLNKPGNTSRDFLCPSYDESRFVSLKLDKYFSNNQNSTTRATFFNDFVVWNVIPKVIKTVILKKKFGYIFIIAFLLYWTLCFNT